MMVFFDILLPEERLNGLANAITSLIFTQRNIDILVLCMVGASGAGKTTLGDDIFINNPDLNVIRICTDEWFVKDGVYQFDPSKLVQAHADTQEIYRRLLRREVAYGATKCVVTIENTNVLIPHREPYKKEVEELNKQAGRSIIDYKEVLLEGHYQNVHDVPDLKVEQMRNSIEPLAHPIDGKALFALRYGIEWMLNGELLDCDDYTGNVDWIKNTIKQNITERKYSADNTVLQYRKHKPALRRALIEMLGDQ